LTDPDLLPLLEGGPEVDSRLGKRRVMELLFNNIVGSSKSGKSSNETISLLPKLYTRMRSLMKVYYIVESDSSGETKNLIERSPSLLEELINEDIWTRQQIIIV
jgi:hypothetical protein